jgi:hypothetical protein
VPTKAEAGILLGDADELVGLTRAEAVGVRGRVRLGAQVVEPVGVEDFWVWVVRWVVEDWQAWGFDVCTCWDVGSVFEGYWFVDVAAEGVC